MPNLCCRHVLKQVSRVAALVIIAFMIPVGSTPRAAAEETPTLLPDNARPGLFDRLKQVQATLKTFQAHFVELRSVTGLAAPIRYEGTLYFEKDRLFFMQYDSPVHHVLRVRGKEALMYIEGSPTADVMMLSNQGAVAENAAFLAWDPNRFTGTISQTADTYFFQDTTAGAALTFALHKQSLIMKHLKIDNHTGDITDIRFSSEKLNAPLPEKVLDFKLPEGVILNRMTQP
ncbi:MAG: outer membrane lipoprotein carrier protein LolA [Desulfobacterales bacterium]|jgi:outer membrane lipoprotein-sorting protein|nr:outer membrane lipoprotein carrier protein LolA [Desulfobacterales bacterium]